MSSSPKAPDSSAYFSAANEEFLQRIRYRENYVRLQLLLQAILACAAEGIAVAGVKAQAPTHQVLLLAVPISLTLGILHMFEDVVARHLARYLSELAPDSWYASRHLRELYQGQAWYRLVAQLIAFVITPAGLLTRYFVAWDHMSFFSTVAYLEVVGLIGLAILIGFEWRRKLPRPVMPCAGDEDLKADQFKA